MAMTDPLEQLGYRPIDLDRFVAELNLGRQADAIRDLWTWPGEDAAARRRRFAGYGRLLAATAKSLPEAGIVDLLLDGRGVDPTVRAAQLLKGGEVLLAEGLGLGPGRPPRYSIPTWIWAVFPEAAEALEAGWSGPLPA
jgi:hypothetical protein